MTKMMFAAVLLVSGMSVYASAQKCSHEEFAAEYKALFGEEVPSLWAAKTDTCACGPS